jgi:hypothetical protein
MQPTRTKDRRRPIVPERLSRLVSLLLRFNFQHDQGHANLIGGWQRYYNTRRTARGRIYEENATGCQFTWHSRTVDGFTVETASVHFWRTGKPS